MVWGKTLTVLIDVNFDLAIACYGVLVILAVSSVRDLVVS